MTDGHRIMESLASCLGPGVQERGKAPTVPCRVFSCRVTCGVTRVSNLAQPETRLPFRVPQKLRKVSIDY
jgi:hypothetical protein